MKSPTSGHPNRSAHNWLAYRLMDRDLRRVSCLIAGDVLDVGCGSGFYRGYVESQGARYVGLDRQPTADGSRPDIEVDLTDGIPAASASFDVVFCISVLEHLPDPRRALAEFARILRPGGRLIMQVPWQWQVHEAPNDYFRFTPQALSALCTGAGLTAPEISSQGGCFSMLALKLNYLIRRLACGPRPLRVCVRGACWPIWTAGQWLAPLADRLDRDWTRESGGYFVVARKQGGEISD